MVIPITSEAATQHSPIRINSNADFSALGCFGSGTENDPWVIQNYEINGAGVGYCIYIGNTTDYIVVQNCNLYGASGNNDDYFWNAGLALYNVINCIVTNNTANRNDVNGIYLRSSNNNEIIGNKASDNGYGIHIDSSRDNKIIGNNASNQFVGIYLKASDNNNITANYVSNNRFTPSTYSYGIYLSYSDNNNIYHNNFINNVNQAYDDSGTNQWDCGSPSGGNYWSDYSGNGDTPYTDIQGDSGAQDKYPLLQIFNSTGTNDGNASDNYLWFVTIAILIITSIVIILIYVNKKRNIEPPKILQ